MQDQLFQALVYEQENKVTWQSLLYDLVKREDMDPWDVDVSRLAQRYVEVLEELKQHDFRISGKVVLAAAMLLKMKSSRFLEEDMLEIDRLLSSNQPEQEELTEEQFYEELDQEFHTPGEVKREERHQLVPRMPQPRKRKVSIYDLMNALDQALEVRRRRVVNTAPAPEDEEMLQQPERRVDINNVIKEVYSRIMSHYEHNDAQLNFSALAPEDDRVGRIYTFVPLLDLTTIGAIDLHQETHLGDIGIELLQRKSDDELEEDLGSLSE